MKNRKYNLALFTTSDALIDYIKRKENEENLNVQIYRIALDEAVSVAQQMGESQIEAILSRYGTARLLRKVVKVPVFGVTLVLSDILPCLTNAANYGKKVFIPSFSEIWEGLYVMEELLKIKIDQKIYYDYKSLGKIIKDAKKRGYNIVIGGKAAQRFTKRYGMNFIECHPSEEVIRSSLDAAIEAVNFYRDEQARAECYRIILNSVSDGIISSDERGRITTINESAKKYLELNGIKISGEMVSTFLPTTPIDKLQESGLPIKDQLIKVKNRLLILNHIPVKVMNIYIGCVTTLKDSSNVIKVGNKVRHSLSKRFIAKYTIDGLICEHPSMLNVIKRAHEYAKRDSTILIFGESGTGKEILAQSIHNLGMRRKKPFVSINCAALPEQLLESELFGYEEGAFTGSKKGGKPGLFEIAHEGSIFLDEIASTPLSLQARLLRVIQEREVLRIGAEGLIPIDVRIISSSNKDLREEIENGRFREDLFFRLNVLTIRIPPLRQRVEDIPLLVNKFTVQLCNENGKEKINIPISYLKKMTSYSWPGNVRQLHNFVERFVLLSGEGFDSDYFDELYNELIEFSPGNLYDVLPNESNDSKIIEVYEKTKNQNEFEVIKRALEKAHYHKGKAARILGISRTTMWKKIKKYNIN